MFLGFVTSFNFRPSNLQKNQFRIMLTFICFFTCRFYAVTIFHFPQKTFVKNETSFHWTILSRYIFRLIN